MTAAAFRKMALQFPETAEGRHFDVPDFRVAGKIFATLAYEKQGYGVLLLSPEQQAGMVADAPEIFSPVPNAWGRKGATRVLLSKVPKDILQSALRAAWMRRAPRSLPNPIRKPSNPYKSH